AASRQPVTDGAKLRYVVVTPARNEEKYIGLVLESMIAQTHRPERWVIVSDGSTDRTDDIVAGYQKRCDWIRLVRMPERRDRSFAAKVQCINAGLNELKDLEFDVVGNLDADISFEPDYFAFLMEKFGQNQALGVAGTPFVEKGRHYDYRFTNIEHVSGACQMFRRECFQSIGGEGAVQRGGIGWAAGPAARGEGGETRPLSRQNHPPPPPSATRHAPPPP